MTTRESAGAPERPLPHVLSRAWLRRDQPAMEYFNLQSTDALLFFSGQIITVVDGAPCAANYGIVCDRGWVTREAHVNVTMGASTALLRAVRAADGSWRVDDVQRPDLSGIIDLDIAWTPSTNALPLNRLQLAIGSSADLDAAWIRLPGLQVERLPQRYTRTSEHGYRYESRGGAFAADLRVDSAGFVEEYGDIWTCAGRAPAA